MSSQKYVRLTLNSLKTGIDKLWSVDEKALHHTLHKLEEKPFEHEVLSFDDERVNRSYHEDSTRWYHGEHVIELKEPVIIEPDYGCVLTGLNHIFRPSKLFPTLYPSLPRYLKARTSDNTVPEEEAILFDVQYGTNYFHFFSDVINKLWVIKRFPALKNLPLIIGTRTYNTSFFQFFLNKAGFDSYNWKVVGDEYLKVKRLFLVRPMPYLKEYWQRTLKLVIENTHPITGNKRYFINRSVQSGRYISNQDEIRQVLNKFNFEILDMAKLSFEEQVRHMHRAQYLIGIHGAGNTNIVFGPPGMKFLEICAANRISCHYYWIARMMKIKYDVILGGELTNAPERVNDHFYLDPKTLSDAIENMLGEGN